MISSVLQNKLLSFFLKKKLGYVFLTREYNVPPNGGVANSIFSMCEALYRNEKKISIVVSENINNQYALIFNESHIIIKHPISVWRPRELSLKTYTKHVKNILRLIDKFSQDYKVISRHLYYAYALRSIQVDFIYMLASFYPDETLEFVSRKENTIMKKIYLYIQYILQLKIEKKLVSSIKNIIVLSSLRQRQMLHKYKVHTNFIHPGVNVPDHFRYQKKNESPKNLLIHCRHEVRKNIDGFLSEVHRHKDYYQNMSIRIIGDGPESAFLKEFVSSNSLNEIVTFYGYQKNFNPFYEWADFLIFPSIQEGFGQVILESIARKVPVICYKDVDAPFKEIIDDQITGVLVNHSDKDSITLKLKEMKINSSYANICNNLETHKNKDWYSFLLEVEGEKR